MSEDKKSTKIIVFDMDETLGSFVELGMFWDTVIELTGVSDETHFFKIIDTFQEFLRPHILEILEYLVKQRENSRIDKLVIYTNNQGPKSWALLISRYFNYKLNKLVFDHVIGSYKVNGKVIEKCRTTHNKKVSDLLSCLNMPSNTDICFIDDQYHYQMEEENVYYIHVKPYDYSLNFTDMINKYVDSFKINMGKEEFIEDMKSNMKPYNHRIKIKSEGEQEIDRIVSKKMILNINKFLNDDYTE